MSTVIASNVPISISIEKLKEFFSFCGNIDSIHPIDKSDEFQRFEVKFESEKALATALLLNDAELDGAAIKVEEPKSVKDLPPQYSVSEQHKATSDNKIQSSTKTGDDDYDDISQEEKPKYAIMAQLLANGYLLSDKIIQKAIEIDNEKGYSTKFKSFLASLDEKYVHSNDPKSMANKNFSMAQSKLTEMQSNFNQSKYQSKLNQYFEKAANHPYGIKVHDFYKNFANDVKDVQVEARRLSELKKQQQQHSSDTNIASATQVLP